MGYKILTHSDLTKKQGIRAQKFLNIIKGKDEGIHGKFKLQLQNGIHEFNSNDIIYYGNTRSLNDIFKNGIPSDISNTKIKKTTLNKLTFSIFNTSGFACKIISSDNKIVTYPSDFLKDPNFGGDSTGLGSTLRTDLAESLQVIFCAYAIYKNNIMPFNNDNIVKDLHNTKIKNELLKKIDIGFNSLKYSGKTISELYDITLKLYNYNDFPEWYHSSKEISKKLYKNNYLNSNTKIYKKNGIVKEIYDIKNKYISLNDDKWNPGDIWLDNRINKIDIIKDYNKFINKYKLESNIDTFNTYIKLHGLNKTIVGVSLKFVSGTATLSKINKNNRPVFEFKSAERQAKNINDDLKTYFWSSKGGYLYLNMYKVTNEGKIRKDPIIVKVEIRAPNHYSAINFEISNGEARGGKAGGNYEDAFKKYNLTWITNTEYREIASNIKDNFIENKSYLEEIYNKQKEFNIKNDTLEDFLNDCKKVEEHTIHANIASTDIIYKIYSANDEIRNKFVNDMANYAGSSTDKSSYHIKLY